MKSIEKFFKVTEYIKNNSMSWDSFLFLFSILHVQIYTIKLYIQWSLSKGLFYYCLRYFFLRKLGKTEKIKIMLEFKLVQNSEDKLITLFLYFHAINLVLLWNCLNFILYIIYREKRFEEKFH